MMQIISLRLAFAQKAQFGLHRVTFILSSFRNQELFSILSLLIYGTQKYHKKSGAHPKKKSRK